MHSLKIYRTLLHSLISITLPLCFCILFYSCSSGPCNFSPFSEMALFCFDLLGTSLNTLRQNWILQNQGFSGTIYITILQLSTALCYKGFPFFFFLISFSNAHAVLWAENMLNICFNYKSIKLVSS